MQQHYFKKHLNSSFKFYAFLDRIPKKFHIDFSFNTSNLFLSHGEKLNYLAKKIQEDSTDENDLIIFCDGDAFPIAPLEEYLTKKLKTYPLLSIQRKERYNDCNPHPSFCCTTISFWKRINGDWRSGFKWENDKKILTDTGGNLLSILQNNKIDWYPLLRSNKINYHPVFFGVYDHIIYHHGAGFRDPIEDTDKYDYNIHKLKNSTVSKLLNTILRTKYSIFIKKMIHPAFIQEKKIIRKNRLTGNSIFNYILSHEDFSKIFYNQHIMKI